MKRLFSLPTIIAAFGAAVLFSGTVSASPILATQTFSSDFSKTISVSGQPPVSSNGSHTDPLTFAYFDGSLGTLVGVEISYSGTFGADYIASRTNAGANSPLNVGVTVNRTGSFDLTLGTLNLTDSDSANHSATYALGKNGKTSSIDLADLLLSGLWSLDQAGDLVNFIGAGDYTIDASAAWYQAITAGPNASTLATNYNWAGTVTVTYLYELNDNGGGEPTPDPVPEPGMLVLFGAGLLGLGLQRRRRTFRD